MNAGTGDKPTSGAGEAAMAHRQRKSALPNAPSGVISAVVLDIVAKFVYPGTWAGPRVRSV
ncbi:MAG: hypothetical protein WKF58_11145 [Ilumatobacteraceae bacterium]